MSYSKGILSHVCLLSCMMGVPWFSYCTMSQCKHLYISLMNFFLLQMDLKFLRNQRFAKKHNLKPKAQIKRAAERKAVREAKK